LENINNFLVTVRQDMNSISNKKWRSWLWAN